MGMLVSGKTNHPFFFYLQQLDLTEEDLSKVLNQNSRLELTCAFENKESLFSKQKLFLGIVGLYKTVQYCVHSNYTPM